VAAINQQSQRYILWVAVISAAIGVVLFALQLMLLPLHWSLAGSVLLIISHALLIGLMLIPSPPEAAAETPDTSAHQLTQQLDVTAAELVKAVQAINDVAQTQLAGANEQTGVIQQVNRLLAEFINLSDEVSSKAHFVTQTSDQTTNAANSGQTAIEASIAVMDQIREQVAMIAETIATLARLTRRIDTIITSVSEIATQSNLLALNASIEAARAGVHGRGFAVVADEVRTLAGQSTQAAGEVRTLLREVQSAITDAIDATQLGMQAVSSGVVRTRQAEGTMRQISEEVHNSTEASRDIYEVIRRQIEGLETISINMERINQIARQNATEMQVVRTVSTNLTHLSNELQETLNPERVAQDSIDQLPQEW
jgi:methyl-accepting chemotaxis protein